MTSSFRSHRAYRLRRLIAVLPHDPEGSCRKRSAHVRNLRSTFDSYRRCSTDLRRAPRYPDEPDRIAPRTDPRPRSGPNLHSEEVMFEPSLARARSSETPSISRAPRPFSEETAHGLLARPVCVREPFHALAAFDSPRRARRSLRPRRSSEAHTRAVLPWGFLPYDVFQMRAATCAGIASPDSATSSGFLNLVTSCSALILSALFHAESVHGVEALRGFPLPVAATAFTARCPFSSSPCAPAWLGRRPEGRLPDAALRAPRCSGIRAPGRSVHDGAVLPVSAGRSSLSLSSLRGILPSSLGLSHERPPLMGFSTTLDESIAVVALQSFKELKSGSFSFEELHPPWDSCPGLLRPEDRIPPRTPWATL